MMNLETLQIFCDLVELQNFSRTAEKHGVSQSAISQQLAQLELSYKTQLINRKKRPLNVTEPGRLFYQGCKDIIERYDQLKNELNNLSRPEARINIAAIFSIGMHTLQPYVKKFMATYPKVNLNIEYLGAAQIYDRILTGDIDIGIVASPKMNRNTDVFPLEAEPLVFVCNPEHSLAAIADIDIHKLQGRSFVAFQSGLASRTLIDDILRQYNVSVQIVMEFDNTETIKRAVEINSGVSILPETTVRTEIAAGSLRAIPFSNEKFVRQIGLILRKDKTLSLAGRYLIELLQKDRDNLL
jgi:LysR family transcriptional regulator, transcriptional activator of the cysJI operon